MKYLRYISFVCVLMLGSQLMAQQIKADLLGHTFTADDGSDANLRIFKSGEVLSLEICNHERGVSCDILELYPEAINGELKAKDAMQPEGWANLADMKIEVVNEGAATYFRLTNLNGLQRDLRLLE